jgi:hypothetical protein
LSLDNYANLSAAHPWVDVAFSKSWYLVFTLGNNGATSIVFKVQQAQNVLGTGVKDVPGKSYTHTDSATGQRIFTHVIKSEELDGANGYRYLRGRVEVTGGTSTYITGILYGFEPLSGSAHANRISEVLN